MHQTFFAFAIVAVSLGMARTSLAQATPSVDGIAGSVVLLEPDGVTAPAASTTPMPTITFATCDADLRARFNLLITNASASYSLNVWAGSQDCSQLANRQEATAVCWPVIEPIEALQSPAEIQVRLQDIVSSAWSAPPPVTYTPASSAVCSPAVYTSTTSLNLYFFFTDEEANPVGHEQAYPITIDFGASDGGALAADSPDGGTAAAASASGADGRTVTAGCSVQRGPRGAGGGIAFGLGAGLVVAGVARRRRRR